MMQVNIVPAVRNNRLLKDEINGLLLTSVGFSLLLVMARIVYTGHFNFAFLVWNLFLATVPYFISYWMWEMRAWKLRLWWFLPALGAWLVFIPNSFYVLTDLFHLHDSFQVPRWFDLLLLLSFAWNSLLMGILSLRQMEKMVAFRWPGWRGHLFIYPVMVLNAFGVYIGRFLRFNSWDVISDPFSLLADIGNILLHPVHYRGAWGMVAGFSLFLVILYTTLKKMSRMRYSL
ncbi:MAG: DUF1361 domain-containing protein [Bacteroidetes bacterium]|nr:DUF1361 domain-containing protein [Bacteroidota bacterium]